MRHWTTTLQCPSCKTVIRYEDEQPEWKESEAVRRQWDEARAFAEMNHGRTVPGVWAANDSDAARWVREVEPHRPYLVLGVWGFSGGEIQGVREDVELRCVDCPSCGAEVFVEHAVSP